MQAAPEQQRLAGPAGAQELNAGYRGERAAAAPRFCTDVFS